jgi:carbon monoxide dehydrogenase subunit G
MQPHTPFRRRRGPLYALCLALIAPCAIAATTDNRDIKVAVAVDGDAVETDVSFSVHATPQQVWQVLTDFDHMAQFVSTLSSSRVLEQNGNQLKVAQSGKAGSGPLLFAFDSVREIDLAPYLQIHSHLLSGSMKQLDGTTELSAQGEMTDIHYHAKGVSSSWIPPLIGKNFIADQTLAQFSALRQEILRRQQSAKP